MPQQPNPTVENHFIAGLKTEFTGLNFPENAATDTQNCVFSLIGDVTRRGGINYEANNVLKPIAQSSVAMSSYRWKNVGGDGQTQMLVQQIGITLYFYLTTAATPAAPVSTTLLTSTINLLNFQAMGNTDNVSQIECQFTDGNGYLIVFHKSLDPFSCTYNPTLNTVTQSSITMVIRDQVGIPEVGVPDSFRPTTLTSEHSYNLLNQGWTFGSGWSGNGTANNGQPGVGWPNIGYSWTFPITSQTNTTSVSNGSVIIVQGNGVNPGGFNEGCTVIGTVTSYVTPFTSMTISVFQSNHPGDSFGVYSGGTFFSNPNEVISLTLGNVGFIDAWHSAIANYPSNADVWWLYKGTTASATTVSGVTTTITNETFLPQQTLSGVQPNIFAAPKGFFTLNPWRQQRSAVSGVASITDIITTARPSTGAWYQGRVFYAGVNSSQQATGDEPYTTWTENIYFSKIVELSTDFGKCCQVNDPTSQDRFAILPSDGGVITIQGCGSIYKLFALRFGLLVFASNGVWFIGGSTGVGFAANDYTITKISSIEALSGTSFIDVMGLPMFWNAEGIYEVGPSQQPGSAHSPDIQLDVKNLTLGSILNFYNKIPPVSKAFARGDYDQINYVIQWCYRSTSESGISNRYSYDTILNFNTVTKAFYVYKLPTNPIVSDVKWIQNPGGIGQVDPIFKYLTQDGLGNITFSEENDFTRYLDFFSFDNIGQNYTSFFTTGYKLAGQALRKFEVPYVYFFSRNPGGNAYTFQSIWDYAGTGNSGRWSTIQRVTNSTTDFSMLYRRLRVRGRGMAMQIKISSIQGQPFDLMGWSVWSYTNTGIS